jgi:hypothetical protein
MRFPYTCSEPATKAKRQRSVFASLASLIASWIYYTLLHPYTVVECIIYPSQPDLTPSPWSVFLSTTNFYYASSIFITIKQGTYIRCALI